jgi:hypothetical protein
MALVARDEATTSLLACECWMDKNEKGRRLRSGPVSTSEVWWSVPCRSAVSARSSRWGHVASPLLRDDPQNERPRQSRAAHAGRIQVRETNLCIPHSYVFVLGTEPIFGYEPARYKAGDEPAGVVEEDAIDEEDNEPTWDDEDYEPAGDDEDYEPTGSKKVQ